MNTGTNCYNPVRFSNSLRTNSVKKKCCKTREFQVKYPELSIAHHLSRRWKYHHDGIWPLAKNDLKASHGSILLDLNPIRSQYCWQVHHPLLEDLLHRPGSEHHQHAERTLHGLRNQCRLSSYKEWNYHWSHQVTFKYFQALECIEYYGAKQGLTACKDW